MNFNTTSTQHLIADEMRQRQWDAYLAACNENLLPHQQALQTVKCLSCGGTFTRAADGSIPCGH